MREFTNFPGFSIAFNASKDAPAGVVDSGKSEAGDTNSRVSYSDALRAAFASILKGKSAQVDAVDGKPVVREIPPRPDKK